MRARSRLQALLLALLTALSACNGIPVENQPVTPQRPTVSSDTNTTAENTFELEFGAVIDSGDRYETPTVLKWGQGERTELFLGWSPVVVNENPDGQGTGDVVLGTRHRFIDQGDVRPSIAYQIRTKLPTADAGEGLGSGETDFFAALIASRSVGKASGTAFYELGAVGDPERNRDVDASHTATVAAGFELHPRTSVFGELGATVIPAQNFNSVFAIGGATLKLSHHFVLDAAVLVGLSEDAPEFQILFGGTRNFGSLGAPLGRDLGPAPRRAGGLRGVPRQPRD